MCVDLKEAERFGSFDSMIISLAILRSNSDLLTQLFESF